jgi:AraC family transcriptional regulator, positive regulator of tynA and feaB
MREVIFACDSTNYIHREIEFSSGRRNAEYYDGDYQITPGPNLEVCIEKGHSSSAYSIFNLRSRTLLRYRRSWHHIRRDKTDVAVIWFVRRGQIAYSDSRGRQWFRTGECGVTRSLVPFLMELFVDEESVHDVFHIVVPSHIFRSYIPDEVLSGMSFSYREGPCRLAERTLWALFDEGRSIDDDVAERTVRNALYAMGRRMSTGLSHAPLETIGDQRFREIIACIQKHLSNPDLTLEAVAGRCGISPRYLCSVLKSHGTSFSEMLWSRRLEKTQHWLRAAEMQHRSITEISYMAGFKSSAHFSRMFKRKFRTTPGAFRAQRLPQLN